MPRPDDQRVGRPHLQRDNQQWIYDWVIKETGQVYHWWSESAPHLPKGVKSHAMISKYFGQQARRREEIARVEDAAGHRRTALELYFAATKDYISAQHPVFEVNDEKRFLYEGVERCYEQVRRLAPYSIERIDVPWNDTVVTGYLHLMPSGEPAPLLFYMPGCDTTCESSPNPAENLAHHRGMHVFSFNGPGLGTSNMRGIALTADNFEAAASAALDVLVAHPAVDADRVVTYGGGMGSFWALRFAAHDDRVKAAATKSTYSDMYFLMNEEAPRWKQLFAFLTHAHDEDELDATMAAMTLEGHVEQITCPTLMVTGEWDLRDPVDEVYRLFDRFDAPHELWMFADQFHQFRFVAGDGLYNAMLDWLVDRLEDKPLTNDGEVLYLEANGHGPNSPTVKRKRKWYEPDA